MKIKEDLTGRKINRLFVLGRDETKIGLVRGSFWICKCDCGNTKSISRHSLLCHGTKSCGCAQREVASLYKKIPDGGSRKNLWIGKYKRRAKKENVNFTLSEQDFFYLCSLDCFYCKSPPSERPPNYIYRTGEQFTLKTNGLDRVHPKGDYSIENCVPCCTECNLMKRNLTKDDFIKKIFKISKNLKNQGVL